MVFQGILFEQPSPISPMLLLWSFQIRDQKDEIVYNPCFLVSPLCILQRSAKNIATGHIHFIMLIGLHLLPMDLHRCKLPFMNTCLKAPMHYFLFV